MVWVLPFLLALPLSATSQTAPASPSFADVSHRADAARVQERFPEAIQLYKQGIKLRPTWSEGWWWLGSIYYEQDRFPEAQAAFERFVATSPKAEPAYAFLGLCEYETGKYDAARRHFSQWALKGSPGTSELIDVALFHWALLLTQEGKFAQALYLLDKAAQHHGPNPLLVEAIGLAWLQLRNLPEDYPIEQREIVWLAGTASVSASADNYKKAQEYAARLVSHYGDRPNVHYFRGMLYFFDKQEEEAQAEFRRELEISPKNASAMIQLALAQASLREKLDEAENNASNALSIDSENPLGHYALGTVLLLQGKYEPSVGELQRAAKLAPGSARVHFQLANAYRRLDRMSDFEREKALFENLKDKQEVFATVEEKLMDVSDQREQPK